MVKRKRSEEPVVDNEADREDGSGSVESDAEEAVNAGIIPAAKLQKKAAINSVDGLRAAFESIRQDGLPWIERLEVVSAEPIGNVDTNDDLKLELAL